MHLLIFDDDEQVADVVGGIAADCGWTSMTATGAEMFWTRFNERRPDAIVLDMQLGASDGIEQLRLLSQQSYTGSVVLMSGIDPRVLIAAQEVGRSLGLTVRALITKPARLGRVRAVLAGLEQAAGDTAPREARPAADAPALRHLSPSMVAKAIAAGQMELHLQPIVAAVDREPVGAEGLVRWHHPVNGLVPPATFVAVAEQDSRVIDQLTAWAIGAAGRHCVALRAQGLVVPINVNVSGRNLHSRDFPDHVAGLLGRAGVPPGAIGLEITETVAMQNRHLTADILTRLRLKGISLSIDDFGTGHSTLEALRQMPFSTIKVDRGFIGDLLTSHDSFSIVRSIIDLAHAMGLTCVAEGVEDKRVADCLTELGVDAMQGYVFAAAMTLDRFAAWIRDRTHRAG